MSDVDDAIEELAEAGLLTERQASVFVLRDVEAVPRRAVAEDLGISVNTVDNTLSTAKEKVEGARGTVEAIDSARYEELPTSCSECGSTLGGRYSEDEDGEAICLDCAGIERDAIQ